MVNVIFLLARAHSIFFLRLNLPAQHLIPGLYITRLYLNRRLRVS